MGTTVATTSLFGDRLDEYDYTDYGVPLHAPIALDGRWITDMRSVSGRPHVTELTLASGTIVGHNELLGCELRVVRENPQAGEPLYRTATVISQLGDKVRVFDPYNSLLSINKVESLTAVYSLHEGLTQGFVDEVIAGQTYDEHGWPSVNCFHIKVDYGAFQSWMMTLPPTVPGSFGQPLSIRFMKPDNTPAYFTVLGPLEPHPQHPAGYTKLAVAGDAPSYLAAGGSYAIDGGRDKFNVTQSGVWAANATSPGDYTTFHADGFVAFTPEMVGWVRAANEPERSTASLRRQPDINRESPEQTRCVCSGTFAARTAPITDINPQQCTITVAGDYVGSGAPLLGGFNTRYRIYAPPGTETRGHASGMLSKWVAAESSRCLYNGYRYESPLAGMQDWTTTTPAAVGRQGGLNFAGQHYTLFRHYDPNLMRFTSPDPAAEFFYNLNTYGGNSPARYYDPDGESILGMIAAVPACVILGPVGVAIFAWQAYDTFKGAEAGTDADGVGGSALGGFGGAMFGEDTARGALNHGATGFVLGDQTYTNSKMALQRSGSSTDDGSLLVTGAAINLFERTGVPNLIRFGERRDPWTGRELSNTEANLAGVFGVLQLGTTLAAPTLGAQLNGGKIGGSGKTGAPRGPTNWKGQPVRVPPGHKMSPVDPPLHQPPIVKHGPFSSAERTGFLSGTSGGTKLAPHHRHQLPVSRGGVIDELYGPGHPRGNNHTKGFPSRHPNRRTLFERGERQRDIRNHWKEKGRRLNQGEDGTWYDPGP